MWNYKIPLSKKQGEKYSICFNSMAFFAVDFLVFFCDFGDNCGGKLIKQGK
jgi:hypothetical protein